MLVWLPARDSLFFSTEGPVQSSSHDLRDTSGFNWEYGVLAVCEHQIFPHGQTHIYIYVYIHSSPPAPRSTFLMSDMNSYMKYTRFCHVWHEFKHEPPCKWHTRAIYINHIHSHIQNKPSVLSPSHSHWQDIWNICISVSKPNFLLYLHLQARHEPSIPSSYQDTLWGLVGSPVRFPAPPSYSFS